MRNKESLGACIRTRRKALGLTQRAFAQRVFVTESAVSKWERGLSYPDIATLQRICQALEISEGELLAAGEDQEVQQEREPQKCCEPPEFQEYREPPEPQAARPAEKTPSRLSRGLLWGQLSLYGLSLAVCFLCDLLDGGWLSWFWLVLAGELTAASLTAVPLLAGERRGLWTLGAFTAALVFLLGVCCLYAGGDWFWVAVLGTLLGLATVFLPYVLRYLPFPWRDSRFPLYLGAELLLLELLLFASERLSGGGWFPVAALAVLLGASTCLLPLVLRRLPLPFPLGEHRLLVWFTVETWLLVLLLAASDWYGGSGWFWLPVLPSVLYGLLFPWGMMLVLRYLPLNGWWKAALCLGLASWFDASIPWFFDRMLLLAGWRTAYVHGLGFRFDFSDWSHWQAQSENINALVLSTLALAALFCAAMGRRRQGRAC